MSNRTTRSSRPMMVAVLMGTALATLGSGTLRANQISPQHLSDIGRYCTTCWRNARLPSHAWEDCTQEVFRRLLERVPPHAWSRTLQIESEERREFLRAIDAVKKRTQRSRRHSPEIEQAADTRDQIDRMRHEDREAVERVARELLTERQQQIVQLSLHGHTVQEISETLGLAPERISDEKYKAIRKLRERLAE
ncbi:MAG: sigma-70 family RNA polymerase sigma factor [Gemmataceae bacterium]